MKSRKYTSPPPVTADHSSIIAWSLKTQRPTEFFTCRLGLPQTERSKHVRGHAAFEGEVAATCRSLYSTTFEVAKQIIAHFTCKENLRANAVRSYGELSARFIEPMLREFGPMLWGSSNEERVTKIRRGHYPSYLAYNDNLDCERITLYLYCWVMSHVMRKLPTNPSDADNLSSDDEPLVPPSAAARRMRMIGEVAGTENTMGIEGPMASVIREPIPVASMFATQRTHPPEVDDDQHRIVFDSDSDTEYDENSRLLGYRSRQTTDTRAKVKRKSDSIMTHPIHHIKRHKDSHRVAISSTPGSRLHGRSSPQYNAASQVVKRHTAYPSPSRGEGSRDQNFPNLPMAAPAHSLSIDHNNTHVGHARDGTARRASGYRANPSGHADAAGEGCAAIHEAGTETRGSENNPNEHSPNRPVTRSKAPKHTSGSQQRPSLVIPMKLEIQAQDLETLRLRLASKIIDIMPSGIQNPNLILLTSFIEVVEELVKASRLQLISIYGDDYHNQQVAIQMWLQCLKHVATFYDITGFKENHDARDDFLKALPRDTRMTVVKPFIHGRANLREFQDDRGTSDEAFADDVASMLFNLGSWGGLLDLMEIEGMTLEFTRDLLAWFK